jgi:hypothetical protein
LFIIYLLKIWLILHISQGCSNLIRITWGGGCNDEYRTTSKWQPDILNEIEYLVFHNYNVFLVVEILLPLEFTFYFSDQFSLLIFLCLLPSSATVKTDNGENMENARYAMNDDTAGFINQKKNRNTSTKTEYDLKLMKNYFASIYT